MNAIPLGLASLLLILALFLAGMALLIQYLNPEPNPWHKPGVEMYGPAVYETQARGIEHAGCVIYERIKGAVWDVVRDGECKTQCAGLNSAKRAAEHINEWSDAVASMTHPEAA